jgi:hypothetical protein
MYSVWYASRKKQFSEEVLREVTILRILRLLFAWSGSAIWPLESKGLELRLEIGQKIKV